MRKTWLKSWFDARDVYLGKNHFKQNLVNGTAQVKEVIQNANDAEQQSSFYDEAEWLIKRVGNVTNKVNVQNMLLGRHWNFFALDRIETCDRMRELFYASTVNVNVFLSRGIFYTSRGPFGLPYAKALVAQSFTTESFQLVKESAEAGDRRGIYLLGLKYKRGDCCEKDEARAKQLFLESAELGYVSAMREFSFSCT